MTDIFTKEKRSWIMSRIRSRNTGIDLKMKGIISEIGCKYVMYPKMYGSPDFVLHTKRIAIFCDGDFWHGYKFDEIEKSLGTFWKNKINQNMKRDRRVSRTLRNDGWSVLRFWEHDIKKCPDDCRKKIMRKMKERKSTVAVRMGAG